MKKNKELIYLVLALLCVWCPMFMAAWDKDKPASSTSLRNSNPEILANWSALEDAFTQDHEFSTGGTNSGKHEVLTMEEESSAGASATNELHVQAVDGGSGQPEFAITSEDGDELQMTKDGDLFSSDGLVVTENATFNGGITLGAGDDLIGSATSDITFNTDKFTVAGDTGNTLVAGTLDVTGATEVTGVATLGDGSLLKTSAAPSTDAMIANKKYVDDNVGSSNYTPNDYANDGSSDSRESVTFPNGMIIKSGFVTRTGTSTTVTFDTAFPNGVVSAQVTPQGAGPGTNNILHLVSALSTSAMTILVDGEGVDTDGYYWMVIGY